MPAIKAHKMPVDKTGSWDGPKAVSGAPNEAATLSHMHAWFSGSEPDKKASYKFPHHEAGTDTPAVIAGVNNALARLAQAKIPEGDRAGVEAHLRRHRKDAGIKESMSEAEIAEAVKYFKKMDDLKVVETAALTEAIRLQEKANLGEWLEARIHMMFTDAADGMFGDGLMSREERIAFSGAIGEALTVFNASVQKNIPQVYQRMPFEGPPEGDVSVSESHLTPPNPGPSLAGKGDWEGEQIALIESALALQEKAVRQDGTALMKVIKSGWGSSGFYPKEVLQRDGAKAFPKGTKMNWNHPTPVEEAERPEGNLNDLASEFVSDAHWMDNGPKGPGLYADAKVFEGYQGAVNSLAPHIGVSINAHGKAIQGSAEGREGKIVQEIMASPFNRVDYVTMPGAGGEVISLFEAARKPLAVGGQQLADADKKTTTGTVPDAEATTRVANSKSKSEEDMAEEKLQEAVATLRSDLDKASTDNARLSEALALRDAKDMAREAVNAVNGLPDVTRARLIESLAKNPPMKDGSLDKEVFKNRIEEAVKAEIQYLEKVAGLGKIRGLGESAEDDDAEVDEAKIEEDLTESFAALGLSEAGVKIAVKGRK